eukprot:3928725-Rhodomonas_salina.3
MEAELTARGGQVASGAESAAWVERIERLCCYQSFRVQALERHNKTFSIGAPSPSTPLPQKKTKKTRMKKKKEKKTGLDSRNASAREC